MSSDKARFASPPFEAAVVLTACLLMTLLLLARTDPFGPSSPDWLQPWDHWKYEYLAGHPLGSFHIQPTCWRIGVPFLIRALGLPTQAGFQILTVTSLVLTGLLIYYWILSIPRRRLDAFLALVMFYSMASAGKLLLSFFQGPDPESYVFTVLALLAIYRGNDVLCAVTLAAGMFTKETLMVVIPLHYSLKAGRLIDIARLKRSLLVGLPAVAVFALLRVLIPAWNDRPDYVSSLPFIYTQVSAGHVTYDLMTAFSGTMETYSSFRAIDIVRLMSWGTLGIALFLPFFAWKQNRELFLRWSPYWLPILFTLAIALNPERRLGSLFPMLLITGLNGIHRIASLVGAAAKDLFIIVLPQYALLLIDRHVDIPPFDVASAVFLMSLCVLMSAPARRRFNRMFIFAEPADNRIPCHPADSRYTRQD